jgi:hypothetical protein
MELERVNEGGNERVELGEYYKIVIICIESVIHHQENMRTD